MVVEADSSLSALDYHFPTIIMNSDNQLDLLMDLGPDPTIRGAIRYFEVVGMPNRQLAERTRQEYGKDLRSLASFLEDRGVIKIDQVSLAHLEVYQAAMKAWDYSRPTQQRKTCAIRTFFRFLYEHGVTQTEVADRLIPPKTPARLPEHLTRQQYETLLGRLLAVRCAIRPSCKSCCKPDLQCSKSLV